MGINVQATKTKQVLSDFTQVVNQTTNNVLQSTNASCTAANTAKLVVGGPQCAQAVTIEGSNINITQDSAAGCKINLTNGAQVTTQDYNDIKTASQQFIQNQLDSDQGWLAIGLSVQTSTNVTKEDIQNRINNISNTDLDQSCEATISTFNLGSLDICADIINSNINLTQDAQSTAIAQCTNTAIINNFFNTQVLQDFAQNTDNHFKSTQEGPLDLAKWLIYAAVIIVGLLIVAGIIFAIFYFASEETK